MKKEKTDKKKVKSERKKVKTEKKKVITEEKKVKIEKQNKSEENKIQNNKSEDQKTNRCFSAINYFITSSNFKKGEDALNFCLKNLHRILSIDVTQNDTQNFYVECKQKKEIFKFIEMKFFLKEWFPLSSLHQFFTLDRLNKIEDCDGLMKLFRSLPHFNVFLRRLQLLMSIGLADSYYLQEILLNLFRTAEELIGIIFHYLLVKEKLKKLKDFEFRLTSNLLSESVYNKWIRIIFAFNNESSINVEVINGIIKNIIFKETFKEMFDYDEFVKDKRNYANLSFWCYALFLTTWSIDRLIYCNSIFVYDKLSTILRSLSPTSISVSYDDLTKQLSFILFIHKLIYIKTNSSNGNEKKRMKKDEQFSVLDEMDQISFIDHLSSKKSIGNEYVKFRYERLNPIFYEILFQHFSQLESVFFKSQKKKKKDQSSDDDDDDDENETKEYQNNLSNKEKELMELYQFKSKKLKLEEILKHFVESKDKDKILQTFFDYFQSTNCQSEIPFENYFDKFFEQLLHYHMMSDENKIYDLTQYIFLNVVLSSSISFQNVTTTIDVRINDRKRKLCDKESKELSLNSVVDNLSKIDIIQLHQMPMNRNVLNYYMKIFFDLFEKKLLKTERRELMPSIYLIFASLRTDITEKFLKLLWSFISGKQTNLQQISIYYLGSFLVNCRTISTKCIFEQLGKLVKCSKKLLSQFNSSLATSGKNIRDKFSTDATIIHSSSSDIFSTTDILNYKRNILFYSFCQIIFYVFVHRHTVLLSPSSSYVDVIQREWFLHSLLFSRLNPARFVPRKLIKNFLFVAKFYRLFTYTFDDTLVGHDNSSSNYSVSHGFNQSWNEMNNEDVSIMKDLRISFPFDGLSFVNYSLRSLFHSVQRNCSNDLSLFQNINDQITFDDEGKVRRIRRTISERSDQYDMDDCNLYMIDD
ncbi:hypothetical protein SNEBB_001593 [Seison nebaliae]|nr:hypothetical protein SNEBB_001593 [Seison nebaliae]